jgi:hypothetical protein
VGIAAIILLTPFITQNKWANIFKKLYLILIFPLLGMMFTSIGIRIGEFGFTENRYFILIIGLWSTFAVVFMNIYKGRKNTILLMSLAVTAFLTVCGPWDAFNISVISQNNRFVSILNKYSMISDGRIVKASKEVEDTDKKEISEIIRYFQYSHEYKDLKILPKDFTKDKMKEVFGFEEFFGSTPGEMNYFNYFRVSNVSSVVSGYDVMYGFEFYNNSAGSEIVYDDSSSSIYGKVKINIDTRYNMSIIRNNQIFYTFNILDNLIDISQKYNNMRGKESSKQEIIYTDTSNKADIKIIYRDISLNLKGENNKPVPNNVRADLFIRFK